MRKWISAKSAANLLLLSLLLLFGLHILILDGVIPHNIIWGGQIKDTTALNSYQAIALIITVLFIFIIAAKIGYLKVGRLKGIVNVGAWIVFAFFVINTIGNLLSGVALEHWFFTPITVLLSLLAWRVAVNNNTRVRRW